MKMRFDDFNVGKLLNRSLDRQGIGLTGDIAVQEHSTALGHDVNSRKVEVLH